MKKLLLIPFCIALFSCNCKKSIVEEKGISSEASFQVLIESAYQGKEEQSYEVVKDQAALEKLYEAINDNQVPRIDFKKESVVALFLGLKSSGGYGIKIKDVTEKNSKIYLTVEKTSPKPGENVTMAMTNPFVIVKINSVKEIIFQ